MRKRFLKRRILLGILVLCLVALALLCLNPTKEPDPEWNVQRERCLSRDEQDAESSIQADKWIVTTFTTTSEHKALLKLRPIPGWKLLVVGDKTAPPDGWPLEEDNTIFLSPTHQSSLGYKVLEFLPSNASRKIVGYLYALQHGARIILDTDHDTFSHLSNSKVNLEEIFVLDKPRTRGLLLTDQQDRNVVNPYKHFTRKLAYPRGYPVHLAGPTAAFNHTYTVCPNLPTPLIQQGVVGGGGSAVDVDARLKKTGFFTLPLDPSAPPVILPRGIFAPFNSRSTVFHYAAFWGLVLPPSLPPPLADIWRGYWAQALLWRVGGRLGFYSVPPQSPSAQDASLGIKNTKDRVLEEVRIHTQALDLIQLLTNWDCPLETFFGCMTHLSETLAQSGMWSLADAHLISAWIEDLKELGYPEPGLKPASTSTLPCCDDKGESIALFYPVDIENLQENAHRRRETLQKFCSFTKTPPPPSHPTTFPSTLLVLTFNKVAHAQHIWLLDTLYRTAYPSLLYCLPFQGDQLRTLRNLPSTPKFLEAGVPPFSVVRANTTRDGSFAYECSLRAMEMNYGGLSSYLVLQDDVLLNFWRTEKLDPGEMWIYRSGETIKDTRLPLNHTVWRDWLHWGGRFGLNATRSALRSISESKKEAVALFREARKVHGYRETEVAYGEADSYHVPKGKGEMFYEVGRILRESEVYMEIAVHVIMTGISPRDRAVILPGLSLWEIEDRADPFKFWRQGNYSVVHPIKAGRVIRNGTLRAEYCEKYVKNVIKFG